MHTGWHDYDDNVNIKVGQQTETRQ